MYKTAILILFVVLSNCNNKEKSEFKNSDFSNFISQLELVDIERNELFSDFDVNPTKMSLIGDSVFVVTTTTPEWGVYLIDFSGKLLSKYVKPLGNGPGQVNQINNISVYGNEIFVLDKQSNEIEKFIIQGNQLINIDTILLPNYYPLSLDRFIIVGDNYYGLFRNLSDKVDIRSSDILRLPQYLYAINTDFIVSDLLKTLNGSEVIENIIPETVISNPIGFRTTWSLDENILAFSSNESFDISLYDFNSHSNSKVYFDDIPNRYPTNEELDFIVNKFELFVKRIPSFKNNINQRSSFPYYYQYAYNNDYAYYQIQNYSNQDEKIVQINLENNEIKLLTLKNGFVLRGASNDFIFGIEYNNDQAFPVLYNF